MSTEDPPVGAAGGWITVTLLADSLHAEALSDALLDAGALSVDIEDADAGTPDERPQFGEPGLPVAVELWPHSRLHALFEHDADLASAMAEAAEAAGLTAPPPYTTSQLDEQNWVRITQAQFDPIRVSDRLWIVPSWHAQPDPAAINITLDPGMAFGTGSHPTTRLCLEWLDRVITGGETVIDYGCGSGILALAASRLGAARVTGTDIDPHALDAARYNAERNGVGDLLSVYSPETEPAATYPVVVANILAVALDALAPLLASRVQPGGVIALSGILHGQEGELLARYAEWFDQLEAVQEGDWMRITGVRRAG